jgi:hypothetical protein
MINPVKMKIRAAVLWLAQRFGSEIRDYRTGASLGRAVMVCWKGKVHFIGLSHALVPNFLPQDRLTYWKQELGFTQQPKPDFPHEPRS